MKISEFAANCGERAANRALIEFPSRHVGEKAPDREAVEPLPGPFVNAVVAAEE